LCFFAIVPQAQNIFEDSNGKYGIMDFNDNVILKGKYDLIMEFNEGLASVELNKKWGFIDEAGEEVMPLKYGAALSFSEGLASVQINNKYGFIDTTGKEVSLWSMNLHGLSLMGWQPLNSMNCGALSISLERQ